MNDLMNNGNQCRVEFLHWVKHRQGKVNMRFVTPGLSIWIHLVTEQIVHFFTQHWI